MKGIEWYKKRSIFSKWAKQNYSDAWAATDIKWKNENNSICVNFSSFTLIKRTFLGWVIFNLSFLNVYSMIYIILAWMHKKFSQSLSNYNKIIRMYAFILNKLQNINSKSNFYTDLAYIFLYWAWRSGIMFCLSLCFSFNRFQQKNSILCNHHSSLMTLNIGFDLHFVTLKNYKNCKVG